MSIKKGFLRLTIIFSIIVYALAFWFSFIHFDNCRSIYHTQKNKKIKLDLRPLESTSIPEEHEGRLFGLIQNLPDDEDFYKERYVSAKLSLLLIPLAFFAGVWSLWIIYFIIRVLSVWVIRGFKN